MTMHWDYYRCTIERPLEDVHSAIIAGLKPSSSAEVHPHKNYLEARSFDSEAGSVVVNHGARGNAENQHPLVQVSGYYSRQVVPVLRSAFPNHTVARADACFDFLGGRSLFEDITSAICTLCDRRGVKKRLIGDPTDEREGRTLRVGAATSDVMANLYEKGLHELSEGRTADPGWIRWEIRLAFKKRARKLQVAALEPDAVPGLSRWTKATSEIVRGDAVEFIPPPPMIEKSALATMSHMLDQYEGPLARYIAEYGPEAGWRLLQTFHRRATHRNTHGD